MKLYSNDVEAIDGLKNSYNIFSKEVAKVIIGQDKIVRDIFISILCRSHCLLIGVPGLAKTLMINTIASALDLKYSRIQFTPDLMPSDIIGTEILDETRKFKFVKGPVFANIILADEINRTPPKTQSALLEAMQEKTITVSGSKYTLEEPFFVLATQNPIEQEGTYPLPEAQLDRFMFSLWLDYPTFEQELEIVKTTTSQQFLSPEIALHRDDILYFQQLMLKIPVPEAVYQYAVKLISMTRPGNSNSHAWANEYISWGAGPRASQFLILGAKSHAAIKGKYTPDIEDVKAVATAVLQHRIVRNYKAEAENISVNNIVEELMKKDAF